MIISLWMQRPLFELFTKLHVSLAILITATLWQHLFLVKSISRFYILGAAAAYIFIRFLHHSRYLLQNVGKSCARASVEAAHEVIRIKINPRILSESELASTFTYGCQGSISGRSFKLIPL